MPQEGEMLMSRLEMVSPTRAKIVMEGLYKDLERRIEASQPGLCPVDLARAFLELCYAQTCGKCVPCRIGLKQLMFLIQDGWKGYHGHVKTDGRDGSGGHGSRRLRHWI